MTPRGVWEPLPLERVLALKQRYGYRVAVVLPTLDEERTIGAILDMWRPLRDEVGLIDDVVVIDNGSMDGTRHEVERRNIRFVSTPIDMGRFHVTEESVQKLGKGSNMWLAQHHTDSDILVFADSDMENPRQETIARLLSPIVTEPSIMLVKAIFTRDTHMMHKDVGGGRITKLIANPLLQMLFPELATVVQPLNGNIAIRRSAIEGMSFGNGYQVDIEILINAAMKFGVKTIAQIHCGSFKQEGQPLSRLERMAHQITHTVLDMAADHGRIQIHISRRNHFMQAMVTGQYDLDYEWHPIDRRTLPRALEINTYTERFATHLVLLRHAPTEYNAQGRIQGCQDVDVIPEMVCAHLAAIGADRIASRPDVIVTSTLRRARTTAQALVAMHGWQGVPMLEDDRLDERQWGEITGKTRDELRAKYPDIDERIDSPGFAPDGSETHAELKNRVEEAIAALRNAYPGRKVLIVTHRGVLGALGLRHDTVHHVKIIRDSKGYFMVMDNVDDVRHQIVAGHGAHETGSLTRTRNVAGAPDAGPAMENV